MTVTTAQPADSSTPGRNDRTPVLSARGLVKSFGRVVGLDGVDLDLYPGEVLAVIGDNGAGKSTLIKCLTGALVPDAGQLLLDGRPVQFKRPQDARDVGIETVYQSLAVAPALDIASNLFLGRERRRSGVLGSVLRMLDHKGMRRSAAEALTSLGIGTLQNMSQAVETLSGGQRQAVSVARAAAFGSKVIVLDEPTAALGVRESNQVLRMIKEVRSRGLPVILISHNMPHVFEVADRIHIQRLGRSAGVITPSSHTMNEAVAIMTGATTLAETPGSVGAPAAAATPGPAEQDPAGDGRRPTPPRPEGHPS
ncbi:ATP-binding cassette domain-containing protein [Micromonospora sp. KC721]|uniref:ATP-binding cassette domain-containing protein n=1 Tax=Micromonospora sp. KC721 TaxID=2530380 RepID=UPI001044BD15|nr:ATP-binding cassette domain-containing protein [Micromonospora sp. KC721]TDB79118.1 sugar ABC transporter ATP-binding protein [Micromonospora sp. KC721]